MKNKRQNKLLRNKSGHHHRSEFSNNKQRTKMNTK